MPTRGKAGKGSNELGTCLWQTEMRKTMEDIVGHFQARSTSSGNNGVTWRGVKRVANLPLTAAGGRNSLPVF